MLFISCTSVAAATGLSSIPLAKACKVMPKLLNSSTSRSVGYFARSPMVRIPIFRSFGAVRLPTMNSSETGRGHNFFSSSSGKSVMILLGFSNSPAIFASSLLQLMPMLTVKPSSVKMRCWIVLAASRGGPKRASMPVYSKKPSSMLNCSMRSEYSPKS